MRIAILLFICSVPLSVAFAGTSLPTCAQDDVRWYDRKHRDQMDEGQKNALAARASMERIRKKIEEWGLVTISAPVAVMDASKFSLGGDDDFPKIQAYMEKARTGLAASVAELDEQAFSNRGALVATPNLPGAATTTTTTLPASLDPTSVTAPASVTVSSNLSSQTFAPLGKLLLNTPSQISERQALSIAAGDKMTENLFRVMGQNNQIPGHNHIIFAVLEVSCNPGWRTQENYIADCTAFAEFSDRRTNTPLPRCENRQPTIFSVLPLIDAQTIEMANSQRQMSQLAANVAAAFPGQAANIKANDILEFVKRSQRDAVSRKPVPVVNTYSTGKIMGFRFSPSFQAMKDPAVRKSGAANVLLPTAFPALVTLVFHDDDIQYVTGLEKQGYEPCLLTHISTRWLLKDRPPLVAWYRRLVTPMKRETTFQRIDLAMDVAEMYHYYNEAQKCSTESQMFDPVMDELHRDAIELEDKVIGQSWPIPARTLFEGMLKQPPQATIHNVWLASPNTIKEGATQVIELAGEGLVDVTAVQIGATKSSFVQYQRKTGTLKVVMVNFQQTSQPVAQSAAPKPATLTAAQIKTADDQLTAAIADVGTKLKSLSIDADTASAKFLALAGVLQKTGIPSDAQKALQSLSDVKTKASIVSPALDAVKKSPDAAVTPLNETVKAIGTAETAFSQGIKVLGNPADLPTEKLLIDANAALDSLKQDPDPLAEAGKTLQTAATAAKTADAQAKPPASTDTPAPSGAAPPASQATPPNATPAVLPIYIYVNNGQTGSLTDASVTVEKDATSNPPPAKQPVGTPPGADASPDFRGLFPDAPDLPLTAQVPAIPAVPATPAQAPKRPAKPATRIAARQSAH